jgi:hypothetical protein
VGLVEEEEDLGVEEEEAGLVELEEAGLVELEEAGLVVDVGVLLLLPPQVNGRGPKAVLVVDPMKQGV